MTDTFVGNAIFEMYARYGHDNWFWPPEEMVYGGQPYVKGVLNGPVHIEVWCDDWDWYRAILWSEQNDLAPIQGEGETIAEALDDAGDEFAAFIDEEIQALVDLKQVIGHL